MRIPNSSKRLLKAVLNGVYLEEIEGDLEETLADYREKHSSWKASLKHWKDIISILRPTLIKKFTGSHQLNFFGMFQYFIKISGRGLAKNRLFSSVSLASLVIGLVAFHFAFLWVHNEQTVDKFHQKIQRLHFTTVQFNPNAEFNPLSHNSFFNIDYADFPEIETGATLHVYDRDQIKLIAENKEHSGKAIVTDSSFLDILDFKFQQGFSEGENLLNDPGNLLVTSAFAKRVFGEENPIGELVTIKCDQEGTYKIAGVLEDIPSNSSIDFDFLIPRHSQNRWRKIPWDILLGSPTLDVNKFNQKIADLTQENPRFSKVVLATLPLQSIYFERPFEISLFGKYGDLENVRFMIISAFIIFLLTAFSFANLQTSIQLANSKRLGIRKVIGASKSHLTLEMISTRVYYWILSSVLTFVLVESLFPSYPQLFGEEINHSWVFNLLIIFTTSGIAVALSVLLSWIQILRIKSKISEESSAGSRKASVVQRRFVVLQNSLTIVMTICALVVYQQYNFMMNKDLGIDAQGVVQVDFLEMTSATPEGLSVADHRKVILDRLSQNPQILSVSQGNLPISGVANTSNWKVSASDYDYESVNKMTVDPGYMDLLGLEMVEGRFFDAQLDERRGTKVVINEAARAYWGIKEISNTRLAGSSNGGEETPHEIIGVVKDYHYEHLSLKIEPMILLFEPYADESFLIKVEKTSENETIGFLEDLHAEINPMSFFDYRWLEGDISTQYAEEKQIAKVLFTFVLVALVLSAISMFTFAFHEARRRTKEIGIRKVNGASSANIIRLLTGSFMKSVLIAALVSVPIGWYLIADWLDQFANRLSISPLVFVIAVTLAIGVTAVATWTQIWRISNQNAVDSLRYE